MIAMGKTAVVLGASGVVGKALVYLLIQDYRYDKIHVIGRTPLDFEHYKIKETLYSDLLTGLREFGLKGHQLFCCIGTTKAKTPNLEQYKEIDIEIPALAATIAKQEGFESVVVVSSLGANAKASNFYSAIKGQMEARLIALNLPKLHLVQPALIMGKRKEFRSTELMAKGLMSLLFFLWVGPLKKYKPIKAHAIAKAMVWLSNTPYKTIRVCSAQLSKIATY